MKPFIHRYVLPPILLSIHMVLLLPLIFPPVLRPPYFRGPEEEEPPIVFVVVHPDSESSLFRRLHPKQSIPLGIVGFLGVYIVKQVAGKIPLPKDPRRKKLAEGIELTVLFSMGVIEEIWRWALVRLLVWFEGGKGGFMGSGTIWHWGHGVGYGNGGDGLGTGGGGGLVPLRGPNIWEGVYLMSWIWSFVECMISWWNMRPITPIARQPLEASPSHSSKRFRRYSRAEPLPPSRPLLGKRARSDSLLAISDGEVEETGGLLRSFYRKKRNAPPRVLETPQDPFSFHFPNGLSVENDGSTTAYDDSIRQTDIVGIPTNKKDIDVEQGYLSRLRDITDGQTEEEREEEDSENDCGDDEESASSASSSIRSSLEAGFDSQTPLLSSSLPYDPTQQHPHHENQALLQNQHRQLSYNTLSALSDSLPAAAATLVVDSKKQPDIGVLGGRAEQTTKGPSYSGAAISPSGRFQSPLYPPHISYSPSCHNPIATAGPSTATAPPPIPPPPPPPPKPPLSSTTTKPRPPSLRRKTTSDSAQQQQQLHNPPRVHHHHNRKIYGVSVNSLSPYLPFMWRLAALLKHLSHGMIYAWAPALVFQKKFQWWAWIVLVFLAGKEGWHMVEWFSGGALRAGLTKASIVTLGLSALIYLISLGLWGIIW